MSSNNPDCGEKTRKETRGGTDIEGGIEGIEVGRVVMSSG